MPLDDSILGEGIYNPRQAARLIGTTAQNVLRWTRGSGPREPLFKAHYQFIDDTTELSFQDLIEIRVVRQLRAVGVPMQAIRFAIRLASQKFGIERPLSSLEFKTDGPEIFMDAPEGDGELISLSRKYPTQKVFRKLIDQSVSGLEYEKGQVQRWRPVTAKHIVLDPRRAFGDPILDDFGISTHVLYEDWQRTGDYRSTARIYEVDVALVRDAVRYERKLDQGIGAMRGQSSI